MRSGLQQRRLHPSLPIFAVEDSHDRALLYVPGNVMVSTKSHVEALSGLWERAERTDRPLPESSLAARLVMAATTVQSRWAQMINEPFAPVALTLELGGPCEQACSYCYARPSSLWPLESLNEPALAAACDWVAANAAGQRTRFVFSIHGVGETASTWTTARRCLEIVHHATERHGATAFLHATTHGQLGTDVVEWLGKSFDAIDLSCDGPPEIQDAARPRRDGGSSATFVEAAARCWTRAGIDVGVRATVTPATLLEIRRLIHYLVSLDIRKLRLEPVYGVPRGGFTQGQAALFVHEFLETQRLGCSVGIDVTTSSPRLDELHGPFCEVNRQTLRFLANGTTVGCFRGASMPDGAGQDRRLTQAVPAVYDPDANRFRVDPALLAELKRRSMIVPASCHDCLNQLHCARACPEFCPSSPSGSGGAFRCIVQKSLAIEWLWEAAWRHEPRAAAGHKHERDRTPDLFHTRLLASLPRAGDFVAEIDDAVIIADMVHARESYSLEHRTPPPAPWVEYGFTHAGPTAWEMVRAAAWTQAPTAASVYLHVPFCDQRCLFCDCHSVRTHDERKKGHFIERLIADLECWAENTPVRDWPITTIHFGGGTPTSLGVAGLERIVAAASGAFGVREETEWALEMTEPGLADEWLSQLHRLGFRRLHVGVQTLEEPQRQVLGRQGTAAEVLRRLRVAIGRGFTVSVDLIYGLPGQTPRAWLDTIDRLVEAGIHGVSTYALNLSSQNRRLLRQYPEFNQDGCRDCLMLNLAEALLTKRGFQKNHFVHYARPPDGNLYFRHAKRKEPLIALGPSASGCIGSIEYRNLDHPGYGKSTTGFPPLRLTQHPPSSNAATSDAVRDLMVGQVDRDVLVAAGAEQLIGRWERCRLIRPADADGRIYRLSAMGSWLIGAMQQELEVLG